MGLPSCTRLFKRHFGTKLGRGDYGSSIGASTQNTKRWELISLIPTSKTSPLPHNFPSSKTNSDLKKYLDFERYVLGKRLKKNNDLRWKKMIATIDFRNLNWKQNVLLKMPRFFLNSLDKLKLFLLKLGIKTSTY